MVNPDTSGELDDHYRATHDKMTGLLNREGLDERLDYLIDNYPGNFGVLMIDLDDVKKTNNIEGHDSGDELITQAAEAIGEVTRQDDVDPGEDREPDTLAIGREAARRGGDEFILAVPGVNTPEKMEVVQRRVAESLERKGVRASMGGALHQRNMDKSLLLSLADHVMYKEKDRQKLGRQSAAQLSAIKRIGAIIAEHEIDPYDVAAVLTALERLKSNN